MKFNPHEYQQFCIRYIKDHPVSALFLDMGLGKTAITLTALRDLILDEFVVSKALVIAPLRVARDTWSAEVAKWDHLNDLTVSVLVGDTKHRIAALNHNALVYIINRENVKWLVEYYQKNGKRWDFDCVIIDELSSFKNYQSQRFKYLKRIRPFVKRWVGLTGTPTSNGLMDLWAEIGILDGGERLGRFIGRYREAYFRPGSMNPQTGIVFSYVPRQGAEEQIYNRISDITISMKALDYLQMPECISVQDIDLSFIGINTKSENLQEIREKLYRKIIEIGEVGIPLGERTDENGETRPIHNRKLEMLEDLIEAANGQSVLIAYWYKHDRERIMDYLTKAGYSPHDLKSSEDIASWNSGAIPVALIHPASAGHGLNIQAGGHILIWFGLTWSLELYQQTNARLWRQGQDSTVTIHHIITKGTVDEDVMKALASKDVTQEKLIAAVKARLS